MLQPQRHTSVSPLYATSSELRLLCPLPLYSEAAKPCLSVMEVAGLLLFPGELVNRRMPSIRFGKGLLTLLLELLSLPRILWMYLRKENSIVRGGRTSCAVCLAASGSSFWASCCRFSRPIRRLYSSAFWSTFFFSSSSSFLFCS